MKILLVGPYPPPYGGIAVHMKRIKSLLESQAFSVTVYNESPNSFRASEDIYPVKSFLGLVVKLIFAQSSILHIHSCHFNLRCLMGFYRFLGKKVIFTIHGESLGEQLQKAAWFLKKMLLISLQLTHLIICVNPQTKKELLKYGIFKAEKILVLPPYLNPIESEQDTESLPHWVRQYLEQEEFLISANGCVRFFRGEDLYGIQILVSLVDRLRKKGLAVRLLFALLAVKEQTTAEAEYYRYLQEEISRRGLEPYFCFYEVANTEFYPILKRSNLFIRPTVTDGYGISIAEALYYQVPSIASNVCVRPEGTIIFSKGDLDDLEQKVCQVIEKYDSFRKELTSNQVREYGQELLQIYQGL